MRNLSVLILLFIFSCGTVPEKEMRTGLYAKLNAAKMDLHSLNDAEFKACIKNYGPRDTTINDYVFQNAVLATEVKDDSGNTLLSIPPSVPRLV